MQLLNLFMFIFIFCSFIFNVCSSYLSGKVKKLSCEEFPYKVMIMSHVKAGLQTSVSAVLIKVFSLFFFFVCEIQTVESEQKTFFQNTYSSNFEFHQRNISKNLGIIIYFRFYQINVSNFIKFGKTKKLKFRSIVKILIFIHQDSYISLQSLFSVLNSKNTHKDYLKFNKFVHKILYP